MELNKSLFLLTLFFAASSSQGQSVASRLVDANSGAGIPYATIQYGETAGMITNEEGIFTLRPEAVPKDQDSIFISCMGYEKLAIPFNGNLDSVIRINPKPIELSAVYLFDRELKVTDIIAQVKERLPSNYNREPVRQRLFFRQSSLNDLDKLNINFKKSTIEELSKPFLDSVVAKLPRSAAYYSESLCDYYWTASEHRLRIEKAAELYDKNNEGSMEALSEKLERIFKENVKPNSYLKIKSGIFGTRMELDSVFDSEEETGKVKDEHPEPGNRHFLSNRRSALNNLYSQFFFNEKTKLNFLDKANRYRFDLQGYTSIGDSGVYIISFEPKRTADFKGTLYVNIDDYAVMRLDYENVKSLRRIRLLGLSYEERVYKGTTLFSKGENGKYDLRFAEKEIGNKMGIRRPLKVIEKNKHVRGRRKQNELSMDLDISNFNREKFEVVVFRSEPISQEAFAKTVENDSVRAIYLSRYNPEFWEGYDIMEPNMAIRSFRATVQ